MSLDQDPGTPDPIAVADAAGRATAEVVGATPGQPASASISLPAPVNGNGQEKRTQVITWFLGWTLLILVISYASIAVLSAYHPPKKAAYDIITAAQAGLKDLILMVVSGLLGAIAQKHA